MIDSPENPQSPKSVWEGWLRPKSILRSTVGTVRKDTAEFHYGETIDLRGDSPSQRALSGTLSKPKAPGFARKTTELLKFLSI
jgi:hypothetical protein